MNYYEPEDLYRCPACSGEGADQDNEECDVCEGSGEVNRRDRRDWIAEARADSERD